MWVSSKIHSLSKGTPWDLLPTYKITLKREIGDYMYYKMERIQSSFSLEYTLIC